MNQRTLAYWPTRILLGVGFIATGVTIALVLVVILAAPSMFGPVAVLEIPSRVLSALAAVGAAIAGLAWMIRIARGPREKPSSWRYRDR